MNDNIKYGSLSCAMEYAKRGEIETWLQHFLRNDGDNLVFADGLLLEERNYIGPMRADIRVFEIEEGAPSYLTKQNDIEWFFHKVDEIKKIYTNWDMPPLIVNYSEGIYEVSDGRHRLETLRQLGVHETTVLYWTTGEKDYNELRGVLGL